MSQKAAVIADSPIKGSYSVVKDIEIGQPSDDQILIKTIAFAVNPTDWKHIIFKQGSPGDITGSDASGIVEKVGANVKGFAKGDVVSTFLHGNYSKNRGAFAEYVIADPSTTIKYDAEKISSEPLSVGEHESSTISTYEGAASVTLGSVTVVLSFISNLQISKEDKGKYILIWGGSGATGILAIQIAKLALGLKVVTVASKKNFEFVKSLGADLVFDYHDSDVAEQISEATKGEIRYALDTVASKESFQQVYDSTSSSPDVKIDSLLFLGEKDVVKDDRKGKVEFVKTTLAYVANGEPTTLFGIEIDITKDEKKRYDEFWFNEFPKLVPVLKTANLKVLKPGLESADEAHELLQDSKVSGEKVVFRLK